MSNKTNGNSNEHEHEHNHSHSLFSFHSHSHGEEEHGHSHGAQHIVKAFKDKADRGSHITLVGLYANVGLTLSKGLAAWFLHSASLMADAAHSLSDLLGDFITLFCWRWSKQSPTQKYPFGFGKFETLGTTTVSLLLIGGAVGIGMHSYNLLLHTLEPSLSTMSPGIAHDILSTLTHAKVSGALAHSHSHSHAPSDGSMLDPNAAWFALISIVAKEWLYRITKRVADEEKSSVLRANAIHHRSDAFTSVVAFFAILGSWWAPWLPLDPIGGLLVSFIILQQGYQLLRGALRELMDRGVSPRTLSSLSDSLQPLISTSDAEQTLSTLVQGQAGPLRLLRVTDLRAKRSGANMFVDLAAHVPSTMTVEEAREVEESIRAQLLTRRAEIAEVRVKFVPVDTNLKNGFGP